MTNTKFATGAFAFTRARGLKPRNPDDLQPLAAQHGIVAAFVPAYAGDRVAVMRAIQQVSAGLYREQLLLRPIRRTAAEVIYGIVHERHADHDQRLEHDFEATLAWSAEPEPAAVLGDHPIAQRVAAAYRDLRGKVVADDWSKSITAYLEAHDAARVRSDGRIYWAPPQRLRAIKQFAAFLAEVGIDLVLCEIETESRTVVTAAAQESLDEQLATLEAEVEQFDGTQKPSTYARRLDEYQRLRQRAGLYRDALGLGVNKAERVLAELEQKVSEMLDIRQKTVIHRGGSTENTATHVSNPGDNGDHLPVEITPLSTTPSMPSLRFGGALFTAAKSDDPAVAAFTSADQAAIAMVQRLETMGIAGRWQQVGRCKVAIQNSGPPGAPVSIRLRLPTGEALGAQTRSLACLGITIDAPCAG